jgi:DNA-binding transcriptional LysR family regulator
LTVGAISQRIDSLEKYFDAILLLRTVSGVRLTEEGKVVYDSAKEIFHRLDYSKIELQEMQKSPKGLVKIEASTIPGDYIIPQLISGFKNKYPGVDFLIKVSNTSSAIEKMSSKNVEFAAVGSLMFIPRETEIEKIQIGKERLVVIASPENSLSSNSSIKISDLIGCKYISREKGSGTRVEVEKIINDAKIDIPIHMQLGSTESIITAVSEDNGVSIISEIAAKKASKAGLIKIISIKDINYFREFYLIREINYPFSKSSRMFWEYCKDIVN